MCAPVGVPLQSYLLQMLFAFVRRDPTIRRRSAAPTLRCFQGTRFSRKCLPWSTESVRSGAKARFGRGFGVQGKGAARAAALHRLVRFAPPLLPSPSPARAAHSVGTA